MFSSSSNTKQQAAARAEWVKSRTLLWSFRFRLTFCCMISIAVKYNHRKVEQELNGGGQERDSKVADLIFKNWSLGPKTAIFGPKKSWNTFKMAIRRKKVGTLHVALDFSVSRSL